MQSKTAGAKKNSSVKDVTDDLESTESVPVVPAPSAEEPALTMGNILANCLTPKPRKSDPKL